MLDRLFIYARLIINKSNIVCNFSQLQQVILKYYVIFQII